MGLTDKLDLLMKEKKINKAELARESGVPYTTIDGFYKKGSENAKLSTLKKLCAYFGCTLDYLADDNVDNPISFDTIFHADNTELLVERYNQLNNEGQKRILTYAENLLNLQRADESVTTPSKVINTPEHLIANAAHDMGATPEQKANADRIMMDDDEWK